MPTVNDRLKRLRESAMPSITIRAMADALGVTSSAYYFYERANGFKQPFLPVNMARRIAAVLADRGVDPAKVIALAGIEPDPGDGPRLSHGEATLLDLFRRLGLPQRGALIAVAEAMVGAPGSPTAPQAPGPTIHQRRRDFRGPEVSAA